MHRSIALLCSLFVVAAHAQDAGAPVAPPSGERIKEVLDYLENGKDRGPALVDLTPCLKIDQDKASPTLNQCIEPVKGQVSKNTTVMAWLQWYVPKDGKYDDVQLQIFHEAEHRQTIDTPVSGYGRVRSWRGAKLTKVGTWSFKIVRGTQVLGSATVDVGT